MTEKEKNAEIIIEEDKKTKDDQKDDKYFSSIKFSDLNLSE